MRPLELTVEGLRSFRRPVTISFAGRELVAIIGDTGAGKSSILEALTWALYGNSTWTKQAAAVLLGDGSPQMRVRLDFEADGSTWRVTRALRRRQDGTPAAASAELFCLDGDRPAADGVRQVNPAVERLLGLDWEAFTRTVVLPQGQFARLLTEGDVDRAHILAQIWRTDELVAARAQADEALRDLTGHLERLRGRRESYPDDVAVELAGARAAAAEAEKAGAALDRAVTEAAACEQSIERARHRAGAVRDAGAKVSQALAPDPAAEARGLAARAADLDAQGKALRTRVDEQERAVAALTVDEADDGPDRDQTRQAVTTLGNLTESLPDLREHLSRIAALRTSAEQQRTAADALEKETTAAERRLRRAEQDLDRWRRVDAAATAAHGLRHGDDCPVCRRTLPQSWEAPDAAGLDEASAELQAAREAARQVRDRYRQAATRAEATATTAEDETTRLTDRLERVASAVEKIPDPFRPALPQPFTVDGLRPEQLPDALVVEPWSAACERQQRFADRDREVHAARDALANLRDEQNTLRQRHHAEVVEPASRLRLRLERICERVQGCEQAGVALPRLVPGPGAALEQIAEDARTVAEVAVAGLDAVHRAVEEAEREATEQEEKLSGLLSDAGVDSAAALLDRQVRMRSEATSARARAGDLERIAPVVAALDRHLTEGAAVAGGLADLKTLLQDGRFVRWLTLRRSRALLAVASTLLDEMTAGRYAFADITDEHDEWRVFDTETGYARSPRTLSGGESFVASLALALGMVEMVARSGGRLDALFLDEGFGALDRDNLDAAIDALESSATRGRMVAVISHVQAVAERLPDVLAVDRSPSGSQARWLQPSEREGAAGVDAAAASFRGLLA